MTEDFVRQAYGLIEAAEAAIKSPKKDAPDAQTIAIARAIAAQAQARKPSDAVLKTIDFRNPPDWEGILAAIKVITKVL